MASQDCVSKLAQMQVRFQQKQRHEREQRKIKMSEDISLDTNVKKIQSTAITIVQKPMSSSSFGPGKVRQMFDERRQRSTGIDKSYPLKPITTKSLENFNQRTLITQNQTAVKQVNYSRINSTSSIFQDTTATLRQKNDILNGNVNESYNISVLEQQDNIDNETFPLDGCYSPEVLQESLITKLPNVGRQATMNRVKNRNGFIDNSVKGSNNSLNMNISKSNSKLKPVVMRKSPSTAPSNRVLEIKLFEKALSTELSRNKEKITFLSSCTRNVNSEEMKEKRLASTVNEANSSGLSVCRICHRHFNPDRLEKHEKICEKTSSKKRKVFDVAKQRIAGTEVEKYAKKNIRPGPKQLNLNKTLATIAISTKTNNNGKQSNWRKTHEEFINTIRAAKQIKTHLAKGGKLSDLPPPPLSENPNYIQCPHCNRRFNQTAAERHIPKCATFLHNKPKPTSVNASKKRC